MNYGDGGQRIFATHSTWLQIIVGLSIVSPTYALVLETCNIFDNVVVIVVISSYELSSKE